MDVDSFVDNEKQDKRSQKAEEWSATKIHIHPSKSPEFEKKYLIPVLLFYTIDVDKMFFITDKWVNLIIPTSKRR